MTQRRRLESFVLRTTGTVASLIVLSLIFFFLAGAMAHGQETDQSDNPLISRAGIVPIDSDDIGGVVTSSHGAEAGVWVIAETHDLPVRYIKIVVTDGMESVPISVS